MIDLISSVVSVFKKSLKSFIFISPSLCTRRCNACKYIIDRREK
nr:MAG TPA: 4Fe-4S single cluster domain protein [Caudoviricetes sp.]